MFMRPQITKRIDFVVVDDDFGEEVTMPREDYSEFMGTINEDRSGPGVGYRLSAPGYMDCTGWSVADTEQGAIAALKDLYCECDGESVCDLCKELA